MVIDRYFWVNRKRCGKITPFFPRSHALRGNALLDALRPFCFAPVPHGFTSTNPHTPPAFGVWFHRYRYRNRASFIFQFTLSPHSFPRSNVGTYCQEPPGYRHSGLARRLFGGHDPESRNLVDLWIPAFAGMTWIRWREDSWKKCKLLLCFFERCQIMIKKTANGPR